MNSKWKLNFCKGFIRFSLFLGFYILQFTLGEKKQISCNRRKEACTGIVIYDGDEIIKKALLRVNEN